MTWTTEDSSCFALDAARWNRDYQDGAWDYLEGFDESAHYLALASLVRQHSRGLSVLELGCGTGIFHKYLSLWGPVEYLGIDISEVAVAQADSRRSAGARFVQGDVTSFTTDERFDSVVFCESLIYLPGPVLHIRKARGFLRPPGMIFTSIFLDPRTMKLVRLLKMSFLVMDEVCVSNRRGMWTCLALGEARPHSPGHFMRCALAAMMDPAKYWLHRAASLLDM